MILNNQSLSNESTTPSRTIYLLNGFMYTSRDFFLKIYKEIIHHNVLIGINHHD